MSTNTATKPERFFFFSLTDKDGSIEFARRLVNIGWHALSAGGTCKMLAEAGIPVQDLKDIVKGGAILGHKVLTLSRELAASLLADTLDPEELAELVSMNLPFVDFVYCNFYDLQKAINDAATLTREEAIALVIKKLDIGGPTMTREAAKGFRIVVCRKQDMELVLCELEKTGDVSVETRQKLRARAEYEVATYVAKSAVFHGDGQFNIIAGERVCTFKGENGPQSPAALYSTGSEDPLALDKFELLAGADPSYNNWCDVTRLLDTMTHIGAAWKLNFGEVPTIAIGGKHGNACGAAVGTFVAIENVAQKMVRGDTRAIFGGLCMINKPVDEFVAVEMAKAMPSKKAMFDGVIAPEFDARAIEVLSRSKGKCRLMKNSALFGCSAILDTAPRFRYVRGGFLAQPNYRFLLDFKDPDLKVFGEPLDLETKEDLLLAWAIGSTSNSNTITIVKDGMLIGNGTGQQDRVGAAELAIKRAIDAGHGSFTWWGKLLRFLGVNYTKNALKGAVAYSDSFFPFGDGPKMLLKAGVETILSTSGSVKDQEIQALFLKAGRRFVQLPDSKARGFYGH